MAANHPSNPAPDAPLQADRLRTLAAPRRLAAYAPSYSRLVRRLRIVLPLVAVLSVGVVLLWPRIRAEFNHPTQPSAAERLYRALNGRYVGTDKHGRPYTVTFDSWEQAPGGGAIELTNPLAELTLSNEHWVAVKAAHGRYDQTAQTVDLTGQVELFHDDGYRFTTERAHIEFTKNLIWGERAVEGHGPKGEIVGRGFRVEDKGDNIVFTGPAMLTLRSGSGAPILTKSDVR